MNWLPRVQSVCTFIQLRENNHYDDPPLYIHQA